MLGVPSVSDRVDIGCRDNHPVDLLVTTNHMVETDKLQSEVGTCGRVEMVREYNLTFSLFRYQV